MNKKMHQSESSSSPNKDTIGNFVLLVGFGITTGFFPTGFGTGGFFTVDFGTASFFTATAFFTVEFFVVFDVPFLVNFSGFSVFSSSSSSLSPPFQHMHDKPLQIQIRKKTHAIVERLASFFNIRREIWS